VLLPDLTPLHKKIFMRRLKNNWKIVLDNNLYFVEFNLGTTENNSIWVRENAQEFYTKEAAEDYISKSVILEKRLYVEARDN